SPPYSAQLSHSPGYLTPSRPSPVQQLQLQIIGPCSSSRSTTPQRPPQEPLICTTPSSARDIQQSPRHDYHFAPCLSPGFNLQLPERLHRM
ncbi:unnamed protein product, partial [Polarella glacialis]